MLKQNYEVEVLVNGKPLKEYAYDSKLFVEGRKGTTFSLRIRNNSYQRKLFVPSVDGLSVMDGKPASHSSNGYIVPAHGAITIDGWRKSDDAVASFYFTGSDDSYGARIGKGGNLGVVGVVVFDEKEKPNTYTTICLCGQHWCSRCYPYWPNGIVPRSPWYGIGSGTTIHLNASTTNASFSTTSVTPTSASMRGVSQDVGTGWGEEKLSQVRTVEFERGNLTATFEIFYNTREQLEALGVDFNIQPLYVSPQAFPGQYCPPPPKRQCSDCMKRGAIECVC